MIETGEIQTIAVNSRFNVGVSSSRGETADGMGENPERLIGLDSEELTLLCEALDSHVYWQLSDSHYRNDGYVREPGSDDAEAVAAIRAASALEERLRAIERGGLAKS